MPEISDDINEARRFISVKITYDYESDEIIVQSQFESHENTKKLIQLGLEKFLNDISKLNCPHCDEVVDAKWFHCPACGKDL